MKILVTAKGALKESAVDDRFGRAEYFMIYDEETETFEGIENPGKISNSGAGVKASQFVIDQGIGVLITGSLGPKAFSIMSESGVAAFKNDSGSVASCLEAYRKGDLTAISEAGEEVKKKGKTS